MAGEDELRALSHDLRAAGDEIGPKVRTAVMKTAIGISSSAKLRAPVDTGNLKSSIGYRETSSGNTLSAEVGPTANYGKYVELGTSRMAPKPYLGPAADVHEPKFHALLERLAREALGG